MDFAETLDAPAGSECIPEPEMIERYSETLKKRVEISL
jgi:hypothetical protein